MKIFDSPYFDDIFGARLGYPHLYTPAKLEGTATCSPQRTAMSTKVIADKKLTPAGFAAVFCSAIIPGSSSSERYAAARGLLRHKQHEDRRTPRAKDGLDPAYLELHGRGKAKDKELDEIKTVLTDTFHDLLDVVRSTFYDTSNNSTR